ncbi:hypothetical protein EMCRGX_G019430 [Ephydatia muelleri]
MVLRDIEKGTYKRTMVATTERKRRTLCFWCLGLIGELAEMSHHHLWPLFGGRMTKPHRSKLFYNSQRPYMTLGTLRDQVIYPDTLQGYRQKRITEGFLEEYLKTSYLLHIWHSSE